MAGHSKFKNIMHRKGRQDAVRSKRFSRLSKEITVAVKMGGGITNPDMNPRLRTAIQNAKGQSMPKENIQRAISRGESGEDESYREIRYEGYGPGGVAVIVEALTDNVNRSASNIRTCFTKNGGQMGESGSVAFMFDHVGEISYRYESGNENAIMEAAIKAGAEDVISDRNGHAIICRFEDIGDVARVLEDILGEAESVRPVWKPQSTIQANADKAPALFRMMQALEDEDDVQNIYSNFEISEEIMAQLDEQAANT